MNKGLGISTVGTVFLAGLLFQVKPSDGHLPQPNGAPAMTPVSGEGPWLASCKYWSAAQSAKSLPKKAPVLDVRLHETGGTVESVIKASTSPASACPSQDEWGIPWTGRNSTSPHTPEISAVIATVPDPIHSHLALDFDRAMDAILLAATDNHHLSSYYWLPWRSPVPSLLDSELAASALSKDLDSIRERQPGLIILRYDPHKALPGGSDEADYYRVIYVFLVGETPALGVNGTQLQNAFRYEQMLKSHNAWLSPSTRPLPDTAEVTKTELSVIGPFFSGSAASLREGIQAAIGTFGGGTNAYVSGVTSTGVAAQELDPHDKGVYRSFGENAGFEQDSFLASLACAGYDLNRVAVLSEAGTVFGTAGSDLSGAPQVGCSDSVAVRHDPAGKVLNLHFPRELSLLRNAQSGQSSPPISSGAPTPYLNFSLKDASGGDTVPRFSTTQSPLSLEAQLMAIAHQLQRARIQFILVSASNILDDIFLAQFLHRACPDARLVLFGGEDLLFERDGDNQPYIGSISISPYLLNALDFGSKVQWLHSDYQAEAFYNAASYIFWDQSTDLSPKLAGYRSYPVPPPAGQSTGILPSILMQVPLWAAAIGTDGYYPLAVLRWCGSQQRAILPAIYIRGSDFEEERKCEEKTATDNDSTGEGKQELGKAVPESINRNSGISPSLVWMVIDIILLSLCLLHVVLLWGAQFWSPLTRDLAVDQNDQPYRRSVYLNIGTSVLAAMAFVTTYPLLRVGHYYHLALPGHCFAWFTLVAAAVACLSTITKTWAYHYHKCRPEYAFFNVVAAIALVSTIALWMVICGSDQVGQQHSYAGLYFSYRCLQPLSGVCPLLPLLLLLFAWYLWSICQTARLRFSDAHRPRLARVASSPTCYWPSNAASPLFVPDGALETCDRPTDCCLFRNITCLLITVEVARRFCTTLKNDTRQIIRALASWTHKRLTFILGTAYLLLFALCIFASHIHSLDGFLFAPILAPILASIGTRSVTYFGPTFYEFLITALFFPLIMIAIAGWFRAILIWGALSRGLLEPLERLPIRFAFSRFRGGSWVNMLNQSGLHVRWRDMSRSTESIRQLVHHPYVQLDPSLKHQLSKQYEAINIEIRSLFENVQNTGGHVPELLGAAAPQASSSRAEVGESDPAASCASDTWDRPKFPANDGLSRICSVEEGYATFCGSLLYLVLIPYWDRMRTGLVEESNVAIHDDGAKADEVDKGDKAAKTKEPEESLKQYEPAFIHLAEELIVIRYVALIRAVLVNLRYLMLFVSAAFVLAIVAWNSYPLQPHRLIDWCFTLLFLSISVGFVTIFAQMHRNAILSRITDTTPNKLGSDFFVRLATFGALPALTWLAYQFPAVGGSLFRLLQPSLQVMK
jgi:hypothetical protein